MRARKAYISSLSTTGVLIASALVMLTIVGALVAFDRWPSHAVAEAETVPIAADSTDAIGRAVAVRGTAARAGRVERNVATAAPTPSGPVADPVVSQLPAPDTASDAPAASSPAESGAPAANAAGQDAIGGGSPSPPPVTLPPSMLDPSRGDGVTQVTSPLAERFAAVSPALGQTVRGTGTTTEGAVRTLLSGGLH
jgi:hypothetical protein